MCTIAVTGHRPDKLGNDYTYTSALVLAIKDDMRRILINEGCTRAICGMALGVDTVFALLALELGIPLTCAIPFKGQELRWTKRSQNLYNTILSKATNVVYVNEGDVSKIFDNTYINKLFNTRNKWMVHRLMECIGRRKLVAVWDGSLGGTWGCYNYVKTRLPKQDIIIINPNDYHQHEKSR